MRLYVYKRYSPFAIQFSRSALMFKRDFAIFSISVYNGLTQFLKKNTIFGEMFTFSFFQLTIDQIANKGEVSIVFKSAPFGNEKDDKFQNGGKNQNGASLISGIPPASYFTPSSSKTRSRHATAHERPTSLNVGLMTSSTSTYGMAAAQQRHYDVTSGASHHHVMQVINCLFLLSLLKLYFKSCYYFIDKKIIIKRIHK